jgi:hypothetical protein
MTWRFIADGREKSLVKIDHMRSYFSVGQCFSVAVLAVVLFGETLWAA